MKIILLLLLFPLALSAQKVKIETDKFTGQTRVESETAMMFYSFTKPGIKVRYRAVDTSCYISLIGTNLIGVVGNNDYVQFLLANGKTVKAYSTGIQSYSIRPGTYGTINKGYDYQYSIAKDDLQELAASPVASIRATYENNYADIDLKEKQGKNIMEYAGEFIKNIK